MGPVVADRYATSPSAYVHIPFCARVCPYCDFAVVAGRDDLIDRYGDAVVAEVVMSPTWKPLESVYFGGGTPSHVPPALLGRILDALVEKHGIDDEAEISLEANPEDFTVETARLLRSIGFNRVSFGAQSLDGGVLVSLGRRHRVEEVRGAVEAARAGGFDNISIDLIYGTPGETGSSWEKTLRGAIDLRTDHISCYALTVERGTPLGRAVQGGAPAPDPDTQADRYEMAQGMLGEAGFDQYEVSNWSRPGAECRYNLTVWAQGEYLAYGNGAHGHRSGTRFRNLRRVEAYLSTVEQGVRPLAGEDPIAGWEREIDRLFVGLRRTVGVAHGPGTSAFLGDPEGQRLVAAGVVEDTGDRLVVLRPLMTDAVHRVVLGLEDPAASGHPTALAPGRNSAINGIT